MKTVLDEFYTSYLRTATYTDGELRVVVVEGFRAAKPEDINILGHIIKNTYALGITERSRLIEVRFSRPIAWQLIDESFTTGTDYEVPEDKCALHVLTRSRYLDYVREHHGWFEDMRGPGKHYRIWREDEVIDVVACEPPIVGLAPST